MVRTCLRWLQERFPAHLSKRRMFVIGAVVLLLVLAGCGGTPDGETTTAGVNSPATQAGTPATQSDDVVEMEPGTTESGRGTVTAVASQSGAESGLDISVSPATANTTNVTLVVRATVDEESASEGIESVTVDTGGGLDLGTVTVADVDTAGIDEGGVLPGNRTSESLAANVEQDVRIADDGRTLTIPFDGNESVAPGDEIVAVIDGGVATNAPGSYSFGFTVDEGPARTARYTLTAA